MASRPLRQKKDDLCRDNQCDLQGHPDAGDQYMYEGCHPKDLPTLKSSPKNPLLWYREKDTNWMFSHTGKVLRCRAPLGGQVGEGGVTLPAKRRDENRPKVSSSLNHLNEVKTLGADVTASGRLSPSGHLVIGAAPLYAVRSKNLRGDFCFQFHPDNKKGNLQSNLVSKQHFALMCGHSEKKESCSFR